MILEVNIYTTPTPTLLPHLKNPFLDNQVIPLNLTQSEIKDLVEMLRSLEGEGWQNVKIPTDFPQ